MDKDNADNEMSMNRRRLLKTTSTAAITGISATVAATSVSADEKPADRRVVMVNGRKENEYIEKAMADVVEGDDYAPLRERLAERKYRITAADAVVTREVSEGSDGTVTVFLPLLEAESDSPLGNIPKQKGSRSDSDGESVEFGHVVWKSSEPSDAFAIVTGEAEKLIEGIGVISEEDTDGSVFGAEVIGTDSHNIELSSQIGSPERGVRAQSDTDSTAFVVTVDVDVETVNRIDGPSAEVADAADGDLTAAATSCPDSIPVILGAISGCGATCSKCATLSIGNPTAIFGCIGCASCGCGLGCCLGERSSTLCSAASSYLSLPGFIVSPAATAGAICVNEGCNDETCF